METITHTELKNKLLGMDKATFCSITAETQPEIFNKGGKKAPAMLESIQMKHNGFTKHTKLVGLISCGSVSYQDFVNGRLTKEAGAKGEDTPQLQFSSREHKWATRVENSNAVLEHKYKPGQYYLCIFCVANNKPISHYTYEGQSVDIKDSKFDPWRKPNKKEGSNQGTETPIIVRDYAFNSIKEITLNKETYQVVPD